MFPECNIDMLQTRAIIHSGQCVNDLLSFDDVQGATKHEKREREEKECVYV